MANYTVLGIITFVFFDLLVIRPIFSFSVDDPIIETNVGLIRGQQADDGNYSMFLGIPYATVNPDNIFGPSISNPTFNTVFDANDDSSICPQIEEFNQTFVGEIDCLQLNIYVPNSASVENPLPVLAYIYGGGFSIGFAGRYMYGPKFYMKHDVIVVTFNYRLGPYGFMCLGTPDVPGNQGLKDQLIALRWIKENIPAFGGDASKITIGGSSAGATSVDFHLHYTAEGLFHQAFLQSGTSESDWAIGNADKEYPLKLAASLGHEANDIDSALSYLSMVNARTLIEASAQLPSLVVCIEDELDNVERFIHEHPRNVEIPRVKDVSILIGINDGEMLSAYAQIRDDLLPFLNSAARNIQGFFDVSEEKFNEMESVMRHFYFGDEDYGSNIRKEMEKLDADLFMNYPTTRSINKYIEYGCTSVYQYFFSYVGERNFARHKDNIGPEFSGAAHADELGYVFDISYMSEPNAEDQDIIDKMSAMWANFIKFGEPVPVTSELLPIRWLPMTKENHYYLEINSNLTLGRRVLHDRMAFLDLYFEFYKDFLKFATSNINNSAMAYKSNIKIISLMFMFVFWKFLF